ncbi:MAG: methionine--tRNA ligase subunit beta [Candidatus Omnitrophota bacterium]
MITYDDFAKMEIRIGTILEAERVPNTDKLLKLMVDIGGEKRQLVAGIGMQYEPLKLIGKQTPVLINLQPANIRGVESNGMILAADANGKPVILVPKKKVPPGSRVK